MDKKRASVDGRNRAKPMVSPVTSEQIRAARALLRWEQKDLSQKTHISLPTIKRIEKTSGPIKALNITISAIIRAFTRSGISFINDPPGTFGVMHQIDESSKAVVPGA